MGYNCEQENSAYVFVVDEKFCCCTKLKKLVPRLAATAERAAARGANPVRWNILLSCYNGPGIMIDCRHTSQNRHLIHLSMRSSIGGHANTSAPLHRPRACNNIAEPTVGGTTSTSIGVDLASHPSSPASLLPKCHTSDGRFELPKRLI